ncbi:hypothetical protein [Clostridium sp.]|jgi:hypothetical protein|uniref:hypothetical protein n=1 Tax=Clostridium sp. TaxID=1506 RepID=UPI003EEC37A2
MKIFTKNKLFNSLLSVLLMALMIMPTNAFASTNLDSQADSTTKELINTFPNFKESLDKNTNGKLVSSNEIYYKYTPKTTNNTKKYYTNQADAEKDFYISEYTKEQYETEIALTKLIPETSLTNYIGDQEGTDCSWLRISLQIYESQYVDEFMAYSFSSWLKVPFITFTDAIGISMSNGLIVTDDTDRTSTRYAEYNYQDGINPEGTYTTLPVEINDTYANGVMAKPNLRLGHLSSFNNMMISTGVRFSGTGTSEGFVFGNYLHTEVGIGALNMDAAGLPSLSLSLSYDEHHVSVPIGLR